MSGVDVGHDAGADKVAQEARKVIERCESIHGGKNAAKKNKRQFSQDVQSLVQPLKNNIVFIVLITLILNLRKSQFSVYFACLENRWADI